ncbi:MAG TPA: hypothetical protein VGP24_14250, partial [Glaciihabitans sp.]|nr:hypothetical protein [Glaciihabitans sp.]
MSDGWAITAAVATALSAIVVAVQAFYTRKSVHDTAQTLELARKEFDRGSQLRVQAERARIDEEMPRLTLDAGMGYRGPLRPHEQFGLNEITGNYVSAIARTSFRMPADGEELIEAAFDVSILNDGPRSAVVTIELPLGDPIVSPHHQRVVISTGGHHKVTVSIIRPLSRWVDLAQRDDVEVALQLEYVYPGDASATEMHQVLVNGSMYSP